MSENRDPRDPIDRIFDAAKRFLEGPHRGSEMGRGPEKLPEPKNPPPAHELTHDMGFTSAPGPLPGTPDYEAGKKPPIIQVVMTKTPEQEQAKRQTLELHVLAQQKARLLREIQELQLTKEQATKELTRASETRVKEAPAQVKEVPEREQPGPGEQALSTASKMRDIGPEGMPRARYGTDHYDSPRRREELQRYLEQRGLEAQAIAVRMLADVSQGQPAHKAVEKKPVVERDGPERDGPGESRGLTREPN